MQLTKLFEVQAQLLLFQCCHSSRYWDVKWPDTAGSLTNMLASPLTGFRAGLPPYQTSGRLLTHDVLPVRACLPVCPAPASLSMQCSPLDTSSKGLVSWQPAQRANTSSVLGQLPLVRSVPLASPLPKRHLYQLLRAQVGSLLIQSMAGRYQPCPSLVTLLCTAKI